MRSTFPRPLVRQRLRLHVVEKLVPKGSNPRPHGFLVDKAKFDQALVHLNCEERRVSIGDVHKPKPLTRGQVLKRDHARPSSLNQLAKLILAQNPQERSQ